MMPGVNSAELASFSGVLIKNPNFVIANERKDLEQAKTPRVSSFTTG